MALINTTVVFFLILQPVEGLPDFRAEATSTAGRPTYDDLVIDIPPALVDESI